MTGGPNAELRRALAFLGSDRDAESVIDLGRRAGVATGVLAGGGWVTIVAITSLIDPITDLALAALVAAVTGCAATYTVRRVPVWLATLRRTRALGATPGLVGRMVLRMRIEPATERAIRFACRTDDGPLARSLRTHARTARGTPSAGLRSFAREWSPWFPAIDRATTLLRSAATAPDRRRDRCLDRALDAVVAGTADDMASFVGDVRAPVSGLYAFGVLLPLSLVALLPAASATGFPVGAGAFAVTYVVVLPSGLAVAGGWLLLRRPVAFPPPRIDASHPDVPDRRALALGVGTVGAIGASLVATRVVADWAAPVAAVGVGAGLALFVHVSPRRAVLSRVKEVEAGLPDALTIVGGDVAEGIAVERAVANAGESVSGPTGEVFARAGRRSRTLRVGVREAFLGEGGPLTAVPSPRAHGTATLLAVAAREGRPAGEVLLELADQMQDLRDLERESTRRLTTVTRTLANTAALFGPLVGGATVALAAGIGAEAGTLSGGLAATDPVHTGGTPGASAGAGSASGGPGSTQAGSTGHSPVRVGTLGHVVGAYVLLLAAILTALATAMERGFDGTLVAYRVAVALPTATTTYLTAFVAASLLL